MGNGYEHTDGCSGDTKAPGLIMSNRRFVLSHGKTIEVETLESAVPRRTATDNMPFEERFIGCPVWWLQGVLPLSRSAFELVVALYIWRRHTVVGRRTFSVPNGELRALGVKRQVKYRTLAKLREAGLIVVRQGGGEAPVVTIRPRRRKYPPLLKA